MQTTILRTCNLCEAGCGLEFEVEGDRIVSVRPDDDDPFSQGYVCPKGIAIADIHHDPDRLRRPMRRAAGRTFRRDRRGTRRSRSPARACATIRAAHGADAVGGLLRQSDRAQLQRHHHGRRRCSNALGTRNRTSAGIAGHHAALRRVVLPLRQHAGHAGARRRPHRLLPLHRRQPGRLAGQRDGDAERARAACARSASAAARSSWSTRAAPRPRKLADEHVFIRPGGDAAFLLAMVRALLEAGRVDRDALRAHRHRLGRDRARASRAFTPGAHRGASPASTGA